MGSGQSKFRRKPQRRRQGRPVAVPSSPAAPVPTPISSAQPGTNPKNPQLAVNCNASSATAISLAPTPVPSVVVSGPFPPPTPVPNVAVSGPPQSNPATSTVSTPVAGTATAPVLPLAASAAASGLPPPPGTNLVTATSSIVGAITTTTTTPAPAALPPSSPSSIPATAGPSKGTSSLWEQAVEKLRNKCQGFVDLDCGKGRSIQLVNKLIEEVEQKKKECDEKRWFYINKRGEKVFFVETLLGQLNKYAQVGDIAIQHHPDIVALVWSGFRLLLQVGTAYTGDMKTVSESLEYLVRTLCHCDIYEKLYSRGNFESTGLLNTSLVDLYASVLEYLCYARKYLQRDTGTRVLASIFSDLGLLLGNVRQTFEQGVEGNAALAEKEAAIMERLDHRERLKGLLTKIQEPIQNIGRAVEVIFASVEKARRLEILKWLSEARYYDHHSYSSRRRHGDTGHWLLENQKYLDWKDSKSSSILWLRGDDSAGAGKTTLASKVIDEFRTKNGHHALAYFYCYYKGDGRDDPEKILRGLVKQICLANSGEHLPTPLLSIYEKREEEGHSSGQLTLDESRDLIIKLSEGFWQTTIVIDALDECKPTTRRGLFRALNDIVSVTKQVNIFVTGRNDSDIREILKDFPSHYIDATDNTIDINTYIHAEVERRCNPKQLLEGEKPLLKGYVELELKNKIILALKRKANGMFMWVHFQIIAICEEHTAGDVEEALDKLLEDLDTTYKQVFERIDSQSEAARRKAREVLKWVLHSRNPLHKTIIEALSVKPGLAAVGTGRLEWTVPDILDICQNLVVNDEKLKRFRFAHLSVQEFLQRLPEFSLEKSHSSIAEVCLTALINNHSETNYNPEAQSNLIPTLLDYSTSYWGYHVRFSGAGSSTLEKLWKAFLGPSSLSAYNTWGSMITAENRKFLGIGSPVVPPFWTACYYQLHDISRFLLENGADPNSCNEYMRTPLSLAAGEGCKEIAQMLLEKDGVDVNCKDNDGKTPLLYASPKGHKEIVQMLLEKDRVDVNCKDRHNMTPLSYTSSMGHTEVVQMLLEKGGVDVNCKDKYKMAPLSYASEEGYKEIVQMLLEKDGVDVNCKDKYNMMTPLSYASSKGHKEIVQMLLEKDGVDVNCKDDDGKTPLIYASSGGHKEIVQMLLEEDGVDVNCKDDDGDTPLLYASSGGHKEVLQMLLEKDGVDVNCKDDNGDTPLLYASSGGHKEVLQMLLENDGVDVNCKGNNSNTPLLYALSKGHKEIVQMLLEKDGVDVNCKDKHNMTPLLSASSMGHKEIVQMLLEKDGVDVNYKVNYNMTPLSYASFWGNKEIVQVLLEEDGVDVNCKNNDGRTPLLYASSGGHKEVVRMLLEKDGVDVDCKDKYSMTPLSCASSMGHTEVVQMLLEKDGVDVNCKGNDGKTPLSYASSRGHKEIVQMLLEKDGVDVNCNDNDGKTPLSFALSMGHKDVVQMLLEKDGVDVNCKVNYNMTPLSYASFWGYKGIVQMLLERDGVDANCKNNDGKTPLIRFVDGP